MPASLESDAAHEARLDAEAEAAYAAGRYVEARASTRMAYEACKGRKNATAARLIHADYLDRVCLGWIALAYDYIFEFNPRAAIRVAHTLRIESDCLEHFPHRRRLVPGTKLSELISFYPYIIRYRVEGDRVIILRSVIPRALCFLDRQRVTIRLRLSEMAL
jgi:plasmid stabilization system protein ParE